MAGGKVVFLTLKIFSATGGIERMCRIVGKALSDLSDATQQELFVYSLYDNTAQIDTKYIPKKTFKGFRHNVALFIGNSLRKGVDADIVILSHINLLVVGAMIKLLSPKTKVAIYMHGIEVWYQLPRWKTKLLNGLDVFLTVSNYTKCKVVNTHHIKADKCIVINNCLDPFLAEPAYEGKNSTVLNKYGIEKRDIVLLTLSRFSMHDRYKGYDKVIMLMPRLLVNFPHLKYVLAGTYEAAEKQRIDSIIDQLNLGTKVIFTGYIANEELADYFSIADLYVMPSLKEGFGIVFIEALFYGLPVLAGNKDGSVDALANGEFGFLVDPDDLEEIYAGIKALILDKDQYHPSRQKVLDRFSFEGYKEHLKEVLKLTVYKN